MLLLWVALPLPMRLAVLVLLGILAGALINWAIYSFVFRPRPISPWSLPPAGLKLARRWWDRIPIIGWWWLRRETPHLGRWFWIRPLLIEVACGLGLAALYWWETVEHGLLPTGVQHHGRALQIIVHAQFAAHALLFAFLMVATFTDFDDRTIPDMITVPGTAAGMLFLSLCPQALLPGIAWVPGPVGFQPMLAPVVAVQDAAWTTDIEGLLCAWAILFAWSFALMHKVTTLRRGWLKGMQFFWVSLVRYQSWRIHLPIFLLLSAYAAWVWKSQDLHWHALFSSLMGVAVGGGIVWCVRIVGRHSFGMEAMGFGDVTLMAMIGSFLGWQAATITFFLAPVSALVVGAIQWLMTRDNRIAFGPYLSLAAVVLVVFWDALWNRWLSLIFERGLLVAAVLIGSLPLLALLMWLMRKLRDFRERV